MSYYLFNIQFKDNDIVIPEIKVDFKSIELENEFGELVVIENKKHFFQSTDEENRFILFIEEEEKEEMKFDYLFDEEYEINNFNVNFYINSFKIPYDYSQLGQMSNNEYKQDYINSLDIYKRHTLCIEGHRPNDMWGYNIDIKEYKDLAVKVANTIERFIQNDEITHIMNGSDLGFDTISFFAVEYLKKNGYPNLKNVLVVPFININSKWNKVDMDRFERMKESADYVIYTDEINGYMVDLVAIGDYHELKQNKKVFFMIDNSKILLTNWNEQSGFIQNCVAYSIRKGLININMNKE